MNEPTRNEPTQYTYEMKNMKEIKIEGGELILMWDKNSNCATEMRFALEDIENIGLILKPRGIKK